jgi:DNA-binding transcriptional LysR family regulator
VLFRSPLAGRDRVDLSDLKDENFVLISREESPNAFDSVVALCRKHGFTPKIVKQLPNVESLLLSVESGLGVSLFESSIRLFHNENFKFFELDDNIVSVVMASKKSNFNPAISLFTNTVLQQSSESPPPDSVIE